VDNRKLTLEMAANTEDWILIARLLDIIESVKRFSDSLVTDFYDPYRQQMLSPVLTRSPEISFLWTGGYEQAERRRLLICPEYMDPKEQDGQLGVLSVTGNFRFQKLTHRDFLGAVLGLGIKREKVGDLIIVPEGCQVVVDRTVAGYIARNLTKVHRSGVQVQEVGPECILLPREDVKEVLATVPSMRLDAVAAAGYGVSRSKMVDEIRAEKVRVNWLIVTDCSRRVEEGDKIAVRGRGRVEVAGIKGSTKKGRVSLVLRRYR